MSKLPPKTIAEMAVTWRQTHDDEWEFMAREAKREAARRGWASIHNAADRTRMECNVRISNTIKPALSRMLVMEHPELEGYLVLNKASVDEVDIEGIYRERGLEVGKA